MIHIDLFSGIGGFALAVDEVFGQTTHVFCEIDKYCQALLKKRFEGSLIYGDIRTLSRERFIAYTNSNGQPRRHEEVNTAETEQQAFDDTQGCFLLTGGFPCQPFSQAGKRKGTDDNRYLWPEMFRVIRDFKPTWVIAENVRGLLTIEQGMVFEQVCLDLEGEGYEVQAFVIPAVAKNAPHRRDRVWFVAHAIGSAGQRKVGRVNGKEDGVSTQDRTQGRGSRMSFGATELGGERATNRVQDGRGIQGGEGDAPDTRCECRKPGNSEGMEADTTERTTRTVDAERCSEDVAYTEQRRLEESCYRSNAEDREENTRGLDDRHERHSWNKNWLEVVAELCGMDDGVPAELDGLKLSKAKHRVERLKALGNAIVPQVAVEIMKGIKYAIERGM